MVSTRRLCESADIALTSTRSTAAADTWTTTSRSLRLTQPLAQTSIPGESETPMASKPVSVTAAQLEAAALTFDLLSVPGRLHLVWLLANQELDVTTLATATGAAIPAASQQLAKLRAAGVRSATRPSPSVA